MSVSRQMSFLLLSRSFQSELLQYNFLHLDPAAFGFCQGRSVLGRLPEITNKLATCRNQLSMLRLYLCKGFNNLLEQDDKGDVSAETTGPTPAEVSAGTQISAERLTVLLAYP
ncbi:hypothetical protein V6N12_002705 [Hibiscus sabdariffa]|uniref:Uncharacterized protein n=1 Tax=Hibiscus sabdariffa TaxID=183260 RepID=A0ABR2E9R5_9ROSI